MYSMVWFVYWVNVSVGQFTATTGVFDIIWATAAVRWFDSSVDPPVSIVPYTSTVCMPWLRFDIVFVSLRPDVATVSVATSVPST